VLKDKFFLFKLKGPVFFVKGRSQTYELSVDTPPIANSFVFSVLVSAGQKVQWGE
jgi:hypothetical protein